MHTTVTRTIELTPDDARLVLANAFIKEFTRGEDIRVEFVISDTSDDRFGGGSNYNITAIRISGKSAANF